MNQETLPIQYLVKNKLRGEFSSANKAMTRPMGPFLTQRASSPAITGRGQLEPDPIDYQKTFFEAGELLSFQGEEFLDVIYRALLKRAPDPVGTQYFSALLESGVNPRSVIEELRYSEEGEEVGVQINGIRSRLKYVCLSRPLINLRMRWAKR